MNSIGVVIDQMKVLKKREFDEKEKKKQKRIDEEKRRKSEIDDIRSEVASQRTKENDKIDLQKCKETARLLKDYAKAAGAFTGPFFDSLLEILLNFQCKYRKVVRKKTIKC